MSSRTLLLFGIYFHIKHWRQKFYSSKRLFRELQEEEDEEEKEEEEEEEKRKKERKNMIKWNLRTWQVSIWEVIADTNQIII